MEVWTCGMYSIEQMWCVENIPVTVAAISPE